MTEGIDEQSDSYSKKKVSDRRVEQPLNQPLPTPGTPSQQYFDDETEPMRS